MITLADWISAWIDLRTIRLKKSTVEAYRGNLRRYIANTEIGQMDLTEIDAPHIVMLLSPIVAKGYTRQAQLVQVLIGAALRSAQKQRIICYNPMDCVDKIQHKKQTTAWLTPDQAAHFLRTARERQDPYLVAWMLGILCGLRRGEILGLRYEDIDFQRKRIHICRQRLTTETTPKTMTSDRVIPMPDCLGDLLRWQNREGYIVSCSASTLYKALHNALDYAALPRISIHGLRHTMAATAATDGVPIKVLQCLMGHAQYSTTADIYAHVDFSAEIGALLQICTRLEIA